MSEIINDQFGVNEHLPVSHDLREAIVAVH